MPPEAESEGITQSEVFEQNETTLEPLSQALLDAALGLGAFGLELFPIKAGQKSPPLVAFTKVANSDVTHIKLRRNLSMI